MGVQKSINRFLGTIAGAAYVAARLSTANYEKGTSASKKKYTEKVNTAKENKDIKKNISERISSETKEEVPTTKVATMADWFPEAAAEKPAEVKEKVSATAEEQPAEVKEKVSAAVEEQLDSTEDTVVEESIIGDKDASETSSNNVQYNNKKNRNKNKHSNNK